MADASTCRCCRRPLAAGGEIRFWDGRCYCAACLEAALPGLAEYTRRHPRLDEEPQFRELIRPRVFWLWTLPVAFTLAGLVTMLGFLGVPPPFVLLVTVLVLGSLCGEVLKPLVAARVTAEEGRILVRRPFFLERSEHRLDDLRWRMGRAREDSMLGRMWIANRPVVLLVCPSPLGWFLFGQRVACGWTDASRARWVALLTLAGVDPYSGYAAQFEDPKIAPAPQAPRSCPSAEGTSGR